jgi:hypothetical protein
MKGQLVVAAKGWRVFLVSGFCNLDTLEEWVHSVQAKLCCPDQVMKIFMMLEIVAPAWSLLSLKKLSSLTRNFFPEIAQRAKALDVRVNAGHLRS